MRTIVLLFFVGVLFTSLGGSEQKSNAQQNEKNQQNTYVIETEFGDIIIKLYNQTPLHKANFEKLVSEKFYDSCLFHRVIQDFMIQGGDPDSKKALPGQTLGTGGTSYTIPAEIIDTFYHKKGALAAARQSDMVNPQKRSSGSQFYLVQGKKFTEQELNQMEIQINNNRKQQWNYKIFNDPRNSYLKDKVFYFRTNPNPDSMTYYVNKINQIIADSAAQNTFRFSAKARKQYLTYGGTPFLDGSYTVFGEVVSGLNILDSIAKVQKDGNDRPIKDLRMKIKKL